MAYIEINEWTRFQHYKRRDPPWIKLYNKFLDDDDFDHLPDDSKLLFFCLLAFASRRNNHINLDYKWLQKKLPIKKRITEKTLQPLIDAGFIKCYQDDSKMIASCKQNATPETETEERRDRGEKTRFLTFVFLTKAEHKKLIQRYGGKPTKKLIDDLDYYINNKKGKDPYTDHYRTLCKWAIKDNLIELTPSPETKEQEAAGREKVANEKRQEYGAWIKETDTKTLVAFYKNTVHLRWLVKELRPEIADKAKEK